MTPDIKVEVLVLEVALVTPLDHMQLDNAVVLVTIHLERVSVADPRYMGITLTWKFITRCSVPYLSTVSDDLEGISDIPT